jgi:hypothetical protein
MKITLEPLEKHKATQCTVILSIDSDDLNMEQVYEMLQEACLAWGFGPETVGEWFGKE